MIRADFATPIVDIELFDDIPRAALAVRARFCRSRARLHFAGSRTWTTMLSRERERGEGDGREGRERWEGMSQGDVYGEHAAVRRRIMESEPAFQASVVELINIPFSLADGVRRSVFPRNKQTRYDTMLRHTES